MPYLGKSPEFGVRERFYFTQSGAGATSISGFDDNGKSLRFTDGNYVDVYLNGVLLVDGEDYGTSTTNTISGLSALSAGQVVEIIVYDVFNIAKANAEATRTRYYKTASGSETSISGNDDSGVAITFAAGTALDVNLNGVALVAGSDYNTTTANTIGGLSALSSGDVVEIITYEKFVVSDTVSKSSGGTFGGAITATSFSGDGSGLTGVSAGKVLQVVQSSVTAKQSLTITANVYQDTNLTLNITPSAATSKILVIANLAHGNTGANQPTYMRVARTLSGTQTAITAKLNHFTYAANAENNTGSAHCTKLDDPQTTSQLTYTAQISRTNNGTAHFNGNYYQDGFESFLTAIEIGA